MKNYLILLLIGITLSGLSGWWFLTGTEEELQTPAGFVFAFMTFVTGVGITGVIAYSSLKKVTELSELRLNKYPPLFVMSLIVSAFAFYWFNTEEEIPLAAGSLFALACLITGACSTGVIAYRSAAKAGNLIQLQKIWGA